ncbi:hypothetical protein [Rhodococcus sp. GA1]|uniref:hypothetical protein n=1 Tax=Rhodococcus sp. GA1 TaxID=2942275 RepID=UPI0020CF5875|nr:hypothetical protein [Rhodococcus sp. GA1]
MGPAESGHYAEPGCQGSADDLDLEVHDEGRQVVFALTATGSGGDIDPAPLTVRGVITCEAVTEH